MTSSHDALLVKQDTAVGINPPTNLERHRFHFLDALRGIASILVVMRHSPPAFANGLRSYNTFLAVDFFFCLSGFVIAFSYEGRLQETMTFASFTISRVIRLWPTALLGGLLGAAELVAGRYVHGYPNYYESVVATLGQATMGFLILPYISLAHMNRIMFPLDAPMWTLFVEIVANLFFAALVRFRLATNWIMGVVAGVSMVLLFAERKFYGKLDVGYRSNTLHVGLTRVALSFFLGVLVYRLYKRFAPEKRYGTHAFVLAVLLVAVFVACLCDPFRSTYIAAVELTMVCVLFPLIVYVGSSVVLPRRWTAVCAFLGTISYPVYILHAPLLWFLTRANYLQYADSHPSMAKVIMLAFTLFIILTAWASAEFYDVPVRKTLSKMYRARTQPVLV